MKQLLLAALLGLFTFSVSGCCCAWQYLHCLGDALGDTLCGCCDPCGVGHCDEVPCDCGHCDIWDCGCSCHGCGEYYAGDHSIGDHCDPCDHYGNWIGPSKYGGHPIAPGRVVAPGPRVVGSRPKPSPEHLEPTPAE